jgi:hypothetical protein
MSAIVPLLTIFAATEAGPGHRACSGFSRNRSPLLDKQARYTCLAPPFLFLVCFHPAFRFHNQADIFKRQPQRFVSVLHVCTHLAMANLSKLFCPRVFHTHQNSLAVLLDPQLDSVIPPFHRQFLGLLTNDLFPVSLAGEE